MWWKWSSNFKDSLLTISSLVEIEKYATLSFQHYDSLMFSLRPHWRTGVRYGAGWSNIDDLAVLSSVLFSFIHWTLDKTRTSNIHVLDICAINMQFKLCALWIGFCICMILHFLLMRFCICVILHWCITSDASFIVQQLQENSLTSTRHCTGPLLKWIRHSTVYPHVLSDGPFANKVLRIGWCDS